MEAVLAGLGIALANRMLVQEHIDKGQLIVPFELDVNISRQPAYYFVIPEQNLKSEKVQALQQWIMGITLLYTPEP